MVSLDAATRSITYDTARDQTITFNLKVLGRETRTGVRATAEFLHTFEIRGCKGYNRITLGGAWPAANVHDAAADSWSYYRQSRTLTEPNRLVKKELIPGFRYEDPACLFKSYSIAEASPGQAEKITITQEGGRSYLNYPTDLDGTMTFLFVVMEQGGKKEAFQSTIVIAGCKANNVIKPYALGQANCPPGASCDESATNGQAYISYAQKQVVGSNLLDGPDADLENDVPYDAAKVINREVNTAQDCMDACEATPGCSSAYFK